jgi:hypothetical protein
MPYISQESREELDSCIDSVILCLKNSALNNKNIFHIESLNNDELLSIIGNINYTVSRICAGVSGDISYPKIALITGVLENIKQEFYRRLAIPYEDTKIINNGDIKEYKI